MGRGGEGGRGKREECQGEEEVRVMMRCHTTWIAAARGAAVLKCQVEVPRGSGEDTTSWVDGAAQSPENVTWERHMEALPGYL